MSEHQPNDSQPAPGAPAHVDVSARQAASERRRRFIKMGAGVVPVALTLSSRPVLATNSQGKCFSASAWGSVQTLVGTNASQYTRKAAAAPTVTCYTLAQWVAKYRTGKTDYASCDGWRKNSISCADLKVSTVKKYTVGSACGSANGTAGIGKNVKIWDALTGNYSAAQKAMLVAWLNYRISNTTKTDVCVIDTFSSNQLTTLGNIVAAGSGKGPDGKTWYAEDVRRYLESNFIGRLS
ncbi:MAG: hypothetical protein QM788_07190 [Roseateles sp.]|uniref:hypothetical protein n=1 Tax=Roseateles sp. TaxID=1971397 RepID=UPI0039ECFC3C